MPFTPTHTLAIVPFLSLRQWLPLPALAIGSMVPDLGLFYPIISYANTHSAAGIMTTCLPLGVALTLLFELIMRRPLIALLPDWFQERLNPDPQVPIEPLFGPQLRFFGGVALAVVIGAVTHQVWDAFTHQGRWGTSLLPFLNAPFSIGRFALPGYKLLQYSSTLVGLPLLALIVMLMLRRVSPDRDWGGQGSSRLSIAVTLSACLITAIVGAYAFATRSALNQVVGVTICVSGGILMIACIVYCLTFQILATRQVNK